MLSFGRWHGLDSSADAVGIVPGEILGPGDVQPGSNKSDTLLMSAPLTEVGSVTLLAGGDVHLTVMGEDDPEDVVIVGAELAAADKAVVEFERAQNDFHEPEGPDGDALFLQGRFDLRDVVSVTKDPSDADLLYVIYNDDNFVNQAVTVKLSGREVDGSAEREYHWVRANLTRGECSNAVVFQGKLVYLLDHAFKTLDIAASTATVGVFNIDASFLMTEAKALAVHPRKSNALFVLDAGGVRLINNVGEANGDQSELSLSQTVEGFNATAGAAILSSLSANTHQRVKMAADRAGNLFIPARHNEAPVLYRLTQYGVNKQLSFGHSTDVIYHHAVFDGHHIVVSMTYLANGEEFHAFMKVDPEDLTLRVDPIETHIFDEDEAGYTHTTLEVDAYFNLWTPGHVLSTVEQETGQAL